MKDRTYMLNAKIIESIRAEKGHRCCPGVHVAAAAVMELRWEEVRTSCTAGGYYPRPRRGSPQ